MELNELLKEIEEFIEKNKDKTRLSGIINSLKATTLLIKSQKEVKMSEDEFEEEENEDPSKTDYEDTEFDNEDE